MFEVEGGHGRTLRTRRRIEDTRPSGVDPVNAPNVARGSQRVTQEKKSSLAPGGHLGAPLMYCVLMWLFLQNNGWLLQSHCYKKQRDLIHCSSEPKGMGSQRIIEGASAQSSVELKLPLRITSEGAESATATFLLVCLPLPTKLRYKCHSLTALLN